ncbi:hypothetical protein [Caulobacter phage KcrB]|nr:hypothetical protein RW_GP064c [Caulobacter phage RW]WCA46368.1 hypothetical protein [Caulobacter phage KcrB]WCD56303.1 hypothetical protein [Caulobacter phage RLK]WNV48095.1 hypothetical protein GB2A_gp063c [Caulobacter phage GB2A]
MFEDETEEETGGALPSLYSKYAQEEEALRKQEEARIQSRWQRGMQALQQQRMGPSKTQRIAEALLAFGQPTRGGTFAALGNAGSVLAQRNAAMKQAEMDRAAKLREMEDARDESLGELAQKYGAGRLAVLGKLATQVPKTPTLVPLASDPVTGGLRNPLTGQPLPEGAMVTNKGEVIMPAGATASVGRSSGRRGPVEIADMAEASGLPLGGIGRLPDGSLVRNTAAGVVEASPKTAKDANLTPGQKALDTAFGRDYAEWLNGGEVTAKTQLDALRQVKDQLAKGETLSGGAVSTLPPALQKYVDPERVSAQQAVEKAMQATLRATLGAQYTQREGEDLLARSWDPRLPPKENAKKLGAAIAELEKRVKQKNSQVTYFDANGTLQGFAGGPAPTTPQAKKTQSTRPRVSTGAKPAPKISDPKKLSDDEIKRALGLK